MSNIDSTTIKQWHGLTKNLHGLTKQKRAVTLCKYMENTDTQFNVGDRVRVKGISSPVMLVAYTTPKLPDRLCCGWFNDRQHWILQDFNTQLLDHYQPFEDVKEWLRAQPEEENDE